METQPAPPRRAVARNLQISNRFSSQPRLTLFETGTYTHLMSERRFFRAALLVTALVAVASARPGAQTNQRSMYVSVLDASGAPVPDLGPSDFMVRDDNVAREVLTVTSAGEPMQIEVLVDNSAAADDYIADLRRALPPFMAELVKPNGAGTRNEVGLVTLGERPAIATRSTFDAAELKKGAERLHAQSDSGNYLLDGIVEVTKGFKTRGATRPVIVVITTEGPEFSSQHFDAVLTPLRETGAALHVLVVGPNVNDTTDEGKNRSVVLDRGPKSSGGRFEHLLSSMALGPKLTQLANELNHQYRVTFGRPASLIPPETTTVSATKAGLTARGTVIKEQGKP